MPARMMMILYPASAALQIRPVTVALHGCVERHLACRALPSVIRIGKFGKEASTQAQGTEDVAQFFISEV